MGKLPKIMIFLLFMQVAIGFSQTRPGIKMGLNRSNISKTELHSKAGIYVGGFVNIPITAYYALRPEVLYSRQGGKSTSNAYSDVNIDYISIGIPNTFYITPNEGFHFILGMGLDLNIENNFVNLTNFNIDSEISPLDVTIMGGIGYEFGFGLILEARYKQGTISIDFLGDDNLYEEEGSNLNGVFQVGAAYKFKL